VEMATKNLTAGAIQRLAYDPHGPSRQVLWDRKLSGLGVRVMPAGTRSYVLSYRLHGRSRLMHLGRVDDFKNVTDARETAGEHLRKLRREKLDPLAERRRERAVGTLSQMFDQWLAAVGKKRAARTHKDYKRYVDEYLAPEIGSHRPPDLTRGEARRLHAKLTAKSGPVTANRIVQALRACYSWALKQDSDTLPANFANPVTGVEFNRERPRNEFIQPAELPALTREIQAEADPWARAYLWLLLLTGARSGELLKLRWADVALQAGEILLRETKNKSDFKLKLSGAAVDVLRKIPRTSSVYVFPPQRSDGDQPHMARPRVAWAGVLKRASITRNVTLHDLRRSAGVLLSSRGFTAEQIARQLNHKSNITAKVYVQIADDLQQRMADTLGSAAIGIVGAAHKDTPLPPPQQREKHRKSSRARA
jgi:integrase